MLNSRFIQFYVLTILNIRHPRHFIDIILNFIIIIMYNIICLIFIQTVDTKI